MHVLSAKDHTFCSATLYKNLGDDHQLKNTACLEIQRILYIMKLNKMYQSLVCLFCQIVFINVTKECYNNYAI